MSETPIAHGTQGAAVVPAPEERSERLVSRLLFKAILCMAGVIFNAVDGTAQELEKSLRDDGGLFSGGMDCVPLAFDREVSYIQRGNLPHRRVQRQGVTR